MLTREINDETKNNKQKRNKHIKNIFFSSVTVHSVHSNGLLFIAVVGRPKIKTSIQQILVTRNHIVILRLLFQEFDNEEEQSESSSSSKSNRPREERRDKEKTKRNDHRGGRGRSSDSDDAAQTHRSVSPSRQAFDIIYIHSVTLSSILFALLWTC